MKTNKIKLNTQMKKINNSCGNAATATQGTIYVIENYFNDIVYVGRTVQEKINRRFAVHKTKAANGVKSPLYDAMRELGIQNFFIRPLATLTAETPEVLSEILDAAERQYIAYFREQGGVYNRQSGGLHGFSVAEDSCKRMSESARNNHNACKLVKRNDGKLFRSAYEASRAMGFKRNAVAVSICKGTKSGGWYWVYVDEE